MPRIFDNINPDTKLLPALQETLKLSDRADFCIGYFNLRGWRDLAPRIDAWQADKGPCRVLIGMQPSPTDELRALLSANRNAPRIDSAAVRRLKLETAERLRRQLTIGVPTNTDEKALRRLLAQLKAGKVEVKLFLRHSLHAKLYLLYRDDPINPIVGYVGSSNLTFSGLAGQGELNIDVLDHDATIKLSGWFEDRWNDRFCVDITKELIQVIEESWAREDLIPPYHIYLKMAYHLSHEARAGLAEFSIPKDFGDKMFDFQTAAVKIAAHHLNKRGGVIIGDVVGLGKTLMATALARVFEDDYGLETLIICPKNLVEMWEDYAHEYRLRARVLSISRVLSELPRLRRYRLVLIDESHNLRNRNGKRYRAIQEYIRENDSRCILLSATPYNKTYLDLSNQIQLFVDPERDIGIRPERLIRDIGEVEFRSRHQANPKSLAAFEFSEHADDWRDLMRLYMVRRTRGFIQANYAETDADTGRKYLIYEDGKRAYFPSRVPKTVAFDIDESDPDDQYAQLYSQRVVDVIGALSLPRYGLGQYVSESPAVPPSPSEKRLLDNLSRAGKRLIGFCRINLFKRLESGGSAFIQSVERHVLRNCVFLHAIENGLPLPIGTQDSNVLDSRFALDPGFADEDMDAGQQNDAEAEDDQAAMPEGAQDARTMADFQASAAAVYEAYSDQYANRFNWIRSDLFQKSLEAALRSDTDALLDALKTAGGWDPDRDAKLDALRRLLSETHPNDKVIVFSQFADTVRYLESELRGRGVGRIAGVTGDTENPTTIAHRFSPVSNERRDDVSPLEEIRVVVTTDLLSEGQNLQDCSIVVNYDLPWAIIRLIQRAGRVDRIGQTAEQILCYSFLPADGVERIIQLRKRVKDRLTDNAEVVGADETFFEDEGDGRVIRDLYNENSGILDGGDDGEIDLASHAYQIWKNAIVGNPKLEKAVTELPNVALSSRAHTPSPHMPEGVLVFMRTGDGNDALAYVDRYGNSFSESQLEILSAAECAPNTPAQPRRESHHELVKAGMKHIDRQAKTLGGQLGSPRSARYRAYNRLKSYSESVRGQLFDTRALESAVTDIYRYPLRQAAADTLNRQMRSGIDDAGLAELAISLRDDDRLCIVDDEPVERQEPQIICSLGLFEG